MCALYERRVRALYELLDRLSPPPMVTLSRAVAMAHGPRAGLDVLMTLDADGRMASH